MTSRIELIYPLFKQMTSLPIKNYFSGVVTAQTLSQLFSEWISSIIWSKNCPPYTESKGS
jgi:hypothetical protein